MEKKDDQRTSGSPGEEVLVDPRQRRSPVALLRDLVPRHGGRLLLPSDGGSLCPVPLPLIKKFCSLSF